MTNRNSPPLTDLGNGLAIEALETINMNKFVLTACMSLSNPESIHNFARFADVLEKAHQKGVDSVLKPADEGRFGQHALAKQAADVLVMQASLLKTENEQLKTRIADLENMSSSRVDESMKKMFAQKPVARLELREPRTDGVVADYYDVVILNRSQCHDGMELFGSTILLSDITGTVLQNAARWEELLHHAGAESSGAMMHGEFVIRRSNEELKNYNLMKGGVSGHLTDYIDRMLEARRK